MRQSLAPPLAPAYPCLSLPAPLRFPRGRGSPPAFQPNPGTPPEPPRAVDSSRPCTEGDALIPWQKFRWKRPRFARRSLGAAGTRLASASQNLLGLALCFQLRKPPVWRPAPAPAMGITRWCDIPRAVPTDANLGRAGVRPRRRRPRSRSGAEAPRAESLPAQPKLHPSDDTAALNIAPGRGVWDGGPHGSSSAGGLRSFWVSKVGGGQGLGEAKAPSLPRFAPPPFSPAQREPSRDGGRWPGCGIAPC